MALQRPRVCEEYDRQDVQMRAGRWFERDDTSHTGVVGAVAAVDQCRLMHATGQQWAEACAAAVRLIHATQLLQAMRSEPGCSAPVALITGAAVPLAWATLRDLQPIKTVEYSRVLR